MTTSSFWVQSHHSCQQTRSKFVSCCGVQSLFVRSRRKWHSHSHMKLKDCRFTQWPRKIRWKKCIMSSTRRLKRYGDRITSKGIRWQSFGWKRFNCRLLTHWKKPPIVVTRKGSGHSFLSEPALKRELIQRILDEKMSQSWKNVTDSISVSHFIHIVCSLLEFETGILTNVIYSVNHWNVQNSQKTLIQINFNLSFLLARWITYLSRLTPRSSFGNSVPFPKAIRPSATFTQWPRKIRTYLS